MDLAHALHDLVLTLDRHAEQLLRTEGLSYNRYVTCVIVAEHPGLTGRRLARAVGVSEPAMSGILGQLLGAHLLANVSTVGEGNVRRFEITPSGTETLERASALLGDRLNDCARRIGIDPEQLAGTVRALHDEVERPAESEKGIRS